MSNDTTLPILKWAVRLDGPIVDAEAARDGWMSLIRAQGWSPVGVPELMQNPQFDEFLVLGRVVKYPGLTVDGGQTTAIRIPA